MDTELAVLLEKIETLSKQVAAQQARLEELEGSRNGNGSLHAKLDYIVSQLEAQRARQEEWIELKNDLIPIFNHMIKLSIDELAEVGSEFQLEDLLFLLKRLLRDTHLMIGLLDRLEAAAELSDEVQRLGKQVFNQIVMTLDRMEREGYFTFARGGWRLLERVVTEFSEEDINALGDNIVTILKTVRNLTQPEIMNLTNQALEAIRQEPPTDANVSLWSLLKDLADPKVRKGMARLINLVRVLADQPTPPQEMSIN